MRRRIGGIVAACALLVLLAQPVKAQYYEVPPVDFVGPLSHPRYEDGGFYVAMEALYWKGSRDLANQVLGRRGFYDTDGSITGVPSTHLGSNNQAIALDNLGPTTYQPGWNLTVGWRFQSGVSVALTWIHLNQATYSAVASTIGPGNNQTLDLSDTFISAPVVNFPPEFAGNARNLNAGNEGATYGIWNAATTMQILFVQRTDMYDLNARIPVWQTDTYRTYGLFGPRIVALWERFKWRTIDADQVGVAVNETVADYFNVISNRLYGVHLGGGYEWYMGSTPVGAFSFSLDAQASLYFDFANVRASYVRADEVTAASRRRDLTSLVPGLEAKASLWWYPWEAIQIHAGYDFFSFFNTISSPNPVDFNFGRLDPRFESGSLRLLRGFSFGIGFVF